ncbi:TPA: glycosyltransferase [Candidatus Woesearchaeota archaeon]|nr:glycosyltransferase [Candidatus Woesearchaeota archaeon]HIH31155.1 glycosyltransferase [Candidatus Woesearchaeota archaeon]HIH54636.1 glycosyltransferase [Candidatus Woesearchaeota archaeon]HIJ02311.1 glycosyltransferase [Candidatus Woesearchaeota archaeon]HIJ14212.1 glycosyltransferase [Candidatus Woesearchaeota archaeon]
MEDQISIILTTYNRKSLLEMTLTALLNQTNKNFEILIIDDHSKDSTQEFSIDFVNKINMPSKYFRIENEGNNLSIARNMGAEFAKNKYLVFIDDDIVVLPNFIQEYILHFQKNPDAVYLGKLLYVKSQSLENITLEDIKNKKWDILNQHLYSKIDPRKDTLRDLPDYYKVWGGNMGIAKTHFYCLNGYDEDFKSWGGLDSDLGLRLKRNGNPLVLLDDCIGYHMGTNFKSMSEIQKERGVRMFEDEKMHDTSIIRNLNPDTNSNKPIIVYYNKKNYPTKLF